VVLRVKQFSQFGLPTARIALAVLALAISGLLAAIFINELTMSTHNTDLPALGLAALALVMALGLLYSAYYRYFRNPDGAVEVDVANRRLLAFEAVYVQLYRAENSLVLRNCEEIDFDEIESLASVEQKTVTNYVEPSGKEVVYSETKFTRKLIVLPAGTVIFRAAPGFAFDKKAKMIAAAIGRPLVVDPSTPVSA